MVTNRDLLFSKSIVQTYLELQWWYEVEQWDVQCMQFLRFVDVLLLYYPSLALNLLTLIYYSFSWFHRHGTCRNNRKRILNRNRHLPDFIAESVDRNDRFASTLLVVPFFSNVNFFIIEENVVTCLGRGEWNLTDPSSSRSFRKVSETFIPLSCTSNIAITISSDTGVPELRSNSLSIGTSAPNALMYSSLSTSITFATFASDCSTCDSLSSL